MENNFAEVREKHITTLGDLPLVVLSTSEPEIPESFGLSVEEVDQVRAVWDEMQAELAALSSRGERVIAQGSSHYIQFDQPELVIEAIRNVLEAQYGMISVAPHSSGITVAAWRSSRPHAGG